uniref:ANK_REP_REGION domain-containing protein n=1 Tax=Caenorhabditis tropicalis TaxID=1561998 RepID=A0A1I7T9S5_9PELO
MATVAPKGNCLVARAIPSENPSADPLSALFGKLSVNGDASQRNVNKFESQHGVTPSDFRDIQNIRSSALAKKTKTSKFQLDGVKLFADLTPSNKLAKKPEKPETGQSEKKDNEEAKGVESDDKKESVKEKKLVEKKEEDKEEDEENKKDGELLGRGPVHNVRVATAGAHPYHRAQIPYGCAAQTPMADISGYAGYGSGYECGSTWSLSPDTTIGSISASTTPDTVLSSDGYGSASPPQHSPKDSLQQSPYSEFSSDTSRVLTPENNELPESLQDFILQYSNQYTKEESIIRGRPGSADSGVSSPMSARSAPYNSPHVPQGTCSGPTTPSFNQTRLSPRTSENGITAKQRLNAIIPESDLATGFHWACTTWKNVLSNRDADGDTPLHIVAAHNDLGKIYALCETLRKTMNENDDNVFNVSNNFGETPLYVAVLQRSVEVVEYLLELGASPNNHSSRAIGDTPLHFATSRGMNTMVEVLLSKREIKVNETNDDGQTPLLCAVKMHGMMDEQIQHKIDNKSIIEKLIKAGADPTIAETSTGKTIVHHAVDKMDVDLLDFLQTVVNEDTFTELANLSDFQGDTAVDLLCSSTQNEDTNNHVRECLYIRLLASGAVGNKSRA